MPILGMILPLLFQVQAEANLPPPRWYQLEQDLFWLKIYSQNIDDSIDEELIEVKSPRVIRRNTYFTRELMDMCLAREKEKLRLRLQAEEERLIPMGLFDIRESPEEDKKE